MSIAIIYYKFREGERWVFLLARQNALLSTSCLLLKTINNYDILFLMNLSKDILLSKKFVAGTGIVLGLTFGIGLYIKAGKDDPLTPISDEQNQKVVEAEVTPLSVEKAVYEDPAGFSFQYTVDYTVKDITPEDDEYYTLVSLEKEGEKVGSLSVLDTDLESTEEWLEEQDLIEKLKLVGAAGLDMISAEQYQGDGKLYTVAVDKGALYVIKTDKTAEKAYDLLISSFKLALAEEKEGASTGDSSSGNNVIYEPVEVIE